MPFKITISFYDNGRNNLPEACECKTSKHSKLATIVTHKTKV